MLPVTPMPVDPPRDDSGRPAPRRYQYPVGWNLPVGQPGTEGTKLATFATLRSLADMYSVSRACVQKRVSEIVALEWEIVPTDTAEKAMQDDADKRTEWEKRQAEVVKFFQSPDSDRAKYPTFGTWLAALLEDLFVLDAVAVHLHPPRKPKAGPFHSNLASLDLLDGSTVRPLLNLHGATPRPPEVAFQQYVWGVPRVDLSSVIMGLDIEDMTDQMVAEYRADQLMYLRANPRAWTPYGFSPVEQALLPITIGLARQQFQWDYFQDGSIPGQFITPGDTVSSPQQIRELQDALNMLAGDIGAKHRIVVLPPGSRAEAQKPVDLSDQFDEWILSQVTMAFGLTPLDIGISPRVRAMQSNTQGSEMNQTNQANGNQTRLKPVCSWLKAVLFDYVIQNVFGQDDMQWSWGATQAGDNAEQELEMLLDKVQNGLLSIDEARTEQGTKPWGLPESSVPLIWTGTGPVLLSKVGETSAAPGEQLSPGAHPAPKPDLPAPMLANMAIHPDGPNPAGTPKAQEEDTPAHQAAAQQQTGHPAPSGNIPEQKALRAELAVLRRYLAKGRDIGDFKSAILTPDMLNAGRQQLDKDADIAAAVAAVAAAARVIINAARRTLTLSGIADGVSRAIQTLTNRWRNGDIAHPTAIDQAVNTMATGYRQAMTAATQHAADDIHSNQLEPNVINRDATQRAEAQRDYITRLMTDGQTATTTETWTARFNQYGATLTGAYNAGYGQTVAQEAPFTGVIWRLGDTCHCKLCAARADQRFTMDTLPGWPGDGGFGDLCEGGPNCGCWLEFVEVDRTVDIGTNTQRPDSVGYYAEQNRLITSERQQSAARRRQFLDGIPGDAAARAAQRDTVRDQLAAVANHLVQSSGGYPGISVRPQDIPAGIVADLTRGGEDPAVVAFEASLIANVPDAEWAEIVKWEEGRHPRGPHGRFISALDDHREHEQRQQQLDEAFDSEHVHHRVEVVKPPRPKPDKRPKPETAEQRLKEQDDAFTNALGPDDPLGEAAAVHDTAVLDRGDEAPADKHASLSAIAEAARRSHAYTDFQVQQALDKFEQHRAELTREASKARREKAFVAAGSILVGFLMAVFVAPVLAAAPLAVAAIVDLMPDTARSFVEWKRNL